MSCKHENFNAEVAVHRLEDKGVFMANIKIHCIDCGKKFQFQGLEPGLSLTGARVSLDGTEARINVCPEGEKPSPLQKLMGTQIN